jgi:glycosyltransferase involved in cell wall biosynthesis
MNQSPMVSVVMPMYNTEQYVAEAVTSILAQIFSAFELLIVDDGSTDRSLTILQQLANQDPRLRLIIRPNTGYEDLDLWLRLGEVGQRANLRELVLRYRLHTKSVSEQNYARQRQNARIACENAWERRGIEGTFTASERW